MVSNLLIMRLTVALFSALVSVILDGAAAANELFYDTYTGEVLSDEQYASYLAANTTFWCVLATEECDASEWRRIGGACNNLNDPARGAGHTPGYRMKPRVFSNGSEPRLSVSGKELPLARKLRTDILATGRIPDTRFTNLVPHFMVFTIEETNSLHDTVNYLFQRNCCGADADDWFCISNTIPDDDPVFKFSGHTCMNMTRQKTYQTEGCVVADTEEPIRINSEAPLYDLSLVYGDESKLNITRLGIGGLFPYDEVNGDMWPAQADVFVCSLNNITLNETRCHNAVTISGNSFVGLNVGQILYIRNHNRIANALSALNPCWDDERLYYTARDINIASYQQIVYYELFADVMGRHNLEKDGVLSDSKSFRDIYDETLIPTMAEEYLLTHRWFHTIIEGNLKLYDREGVEIGAITLQELTFRTGWYAVEDHLAQILQGSFRQPAAAADHAIDPELADDSLRHFQALSDPEANGLSKSRYLGIAPYIDYLSWCNDDKSIESFDDLEDYFEPQMLEILKNHYEDVRDIDLMAGVWAEKFVEDGWVPATLYCISQKHLRYTIASDRHWYERDNRPHAFTQAQLAEIRKSTVSDVLCRNGDGVTEIQPSSFLLISEDNPLTSCCDIPTIDFNAWFDDSCSSS